MNVSPFDWNSTKSSLGNMCYLYCNNNSNTHLFNDELRQVYLQTLFQFSMHDNVHVKCYTAGLLCDISHLLDESLIKTHIVPSLLSLCHTSQPESVQIAGIKVIITVTITSSDSVVERVLTSKIKEYCNRGQSFDKITLALVEGLSGGILSVGLNGSKSDFWVDTIILLSAMTAAPANGTAANSAICKSIIKSLIECYGVFLQVGMSDGEGRKDQILQGVSMLMSAANVGTKEGLLLEKIWKGFGGARK
jgi:hypothetical protein